jgi:hypothetical protein
MKLKLGEGMAMSGGEATPKILQYGPTQPALQLQKD